VSLAEVLRKDVEAPRVGPLEPVEVAFLGTGVDATHPDLAGRVCDAFEVVRSRGRYKPEKRAPATRRSPGCWPAYSVTVPGCVTFVACHALTPDQLPVALQGHQWVRLLPCKRVQMAATGSTQYGPTALYGPSDPRSVTTPRSRFLTQPA
jgi:hypothetical protein